ncbi:hypothetical protein CVT26_006283 [Gymnopilus dilepis]|uniref:DUF6534 domain-containing protein n=1 Tax=Gymnopilus dilepis TaxID=231916 RepID=A0A409VYS3_9AGAR|nr:hypothetical protein CVT26_006283 [Gymnopilus dilepis]
MSPSLDATLGIWLVSYFVGSMCGSLLSFTSPSLTPRLTVALGRLYGCSLLQIWLYSHWYPLDHWILKAMVIVLGISETLQTIFFFASKYSMFGLHFGDFNDLFVVNWMDTVQLICLFTSAMIVQLFFANCIYALNGKKKIVPVLIVFLSMVAIGSGIAQVVILTVLNNFGDLEKTAPTLQGAASLSCDIVITSSLLYTLNNRKAKATKYGSSSLLEALMVIAINRGVATAIFSTMNIVLLLSMPHTFYFFLGLIPSSKRHIHEYRFGSVSTTPISCAEAGDDGIFRLNSRHYLRSKSDLQNQRVLSLQFQDPVISEVGDGKMNRSTINDNPIRIHVLVETYSEAHTEEV